MKTLEHIISFVGGGCFSHVLLAHLRGYCRGWFCRGGCFSHAQQSPCSRPGVDRFRLGRL